jgi:hypothetical protein
MTAAWLAAGDQGEGGSALGRVVLVAVALLAVGAFAILQVKARSRRRRRPLDGRAVPRPRWPAEQDEPPLGHREASRPDWRYGYPPGYEPYPLYDPDRSPWAVRDEGRSLSATPPRPSRSAAFLSPTLRAYGIRIGNRPTC